MTKSIERYLEIRKLFTFDLVKNREAEYVALCEESNMLKQQMTIAELNSLGQHLTLREFHAGIVPIIKVKKQMRRQRMTTEIKLISVKETASGDYIYELAMSTKTQDEITMCAAKLDLTTEEYLRHIIVEQVQRGAFWVSGVRRDL